MVIESVNHGYVEGSVFAEAMPSKQSKKNQILKVSWFTEREVCTEMVI